MLNATQYFEIKNAFTTSIHNNGDEYTIIKDSQASLLKILLDIISDINNDWASYNLSYDIVSQAVNLLPSDLEKLKDFDAYKVQVDSTSACTWKRLQYLTVNNQSEISGIIPDIWGDIADACAYWYNEQVKNAIVSLTESIKNY